MGYFYLCINKNTDNLSRVNTSKVMDDNMKNIQKIFTYIFHIQSYGALDC